MAWQRSGQMLWKTLGRSGGRNILSSPKVHATIGTFANGSVRWKSDIVVTATEQTMQLPASAATIFSDLTPVLAVQDALCQLHDYTGLTWAPTIVIATVGVRLLVGMPITIIQQKSIFRLEKLQPKIQELTEDIRRETSIAMKIYNWNERQAQSTFKRAFKKHYKNLVEEHNCHPFRSLALAFLQLPAWIALSSAIRNIAYMLPENIPGDQEYRYMQLFVENPLWIESLASPDPFLLPAIFVGANLINLNLHRARNLTVPQSTFKKSIPIVFGVLTIGMGIVATYVPSALSLYWATSSVSALALNIVLRTPGVGSTLGIARKSFSFDTKKSRKFLPKILTKST